jgi:hypothetical protein
MDRGDESSVRDRCFFCGLLWWVIATWVIDAGAQDLEVGLGKTPA